MRVMVMIKGAGTDEDKFAPTQEMFEQMGAYNEQLVDAGIMLDGNGLLPSAGGTKVVFEGNTTTVVEGPFSDSEEVTAGYWIWQVKSLDEAIEWAKKCPNDPDSGLRGVLEVRQIAEAEDFGDAYTDDIREQEEKLGEKIRQQHPAG